MSFFILKEGGGKILKEGGGALLLEHIESLAPIIRPVFNKKYITNVIYKRSMGRMFTRQKRIIVSSDGQSSGVSFSDDFNRINNDNLGSNWTEIVGDLDIVSNKLECQSIDFLKQEAIYSGSLTNTINQYIKTEITVSGGSSYPEYIFRYTNSSSSYYGIIFWINEQSITWVRYPDAISSSSNINSGTPFTWSSGDTIGVTITGIGNDTIIRVWRNPIGNAPDSASSWGGDTTPNITFTDNPSSPVDSGNYVGLGGYRGFTQFISFDNFYAGDIPI